MIIKQKKNHLDNMTTIQELFDIHAIEAEHSKLFYKKFPKIQTSIEKVKGTYYGVMIGDALGNKVEGKLPQNKVRKYGTVLTYMKNTHITDDTQLTFRAVKAYLEVGWFDPDRIAEELVSERIRGIGKATKAFATSYSRLRKQYGPHAWVYAAVPSAGNGALMRLSAALAPSLFTNDYLAANSAILTRITYNDRLAISSSVAWAIILYKLLESRGQPDEDWWLNTYIKYAREIEGDDSTYKSRFGHIRYKGPAWEYTEKVITTARRKNWSLLELSTNVGSGAYLLETVPFSLYALMLHSTDATYCLGRAITDSKDSDTIGAIIGYTLGALHGVNGFAEHLVKPVEKKKLENKKEYKTLQKLLRLLP